MAHAGLALQGNGQDASNSGEEASRATALDMRFDFDNAWAGKSGKGGSSQIHTIHTPRTKGKGSKGGKNCDGGMVDGMDRHFWALWLKFQEFAAG